MYSAICTSRSQSHVREHVLCLGSSSAIRAALVRMSEDDTSPGLLQREHRDGRGTYKQTSLEKR